MGLQAINVGEKDNISMAIYKCNTISKTKQKNNFYEIIYCTCSNYLLI